MSSLLCHIVVINQMRGMFHEAVYRYPSLPFSGASTAFAWRILDLGVSLDDLNSSIKLGRLNLILRTMTALT